MQARKLIRLLQEMIKENPSLAYKEVCVDTRYSKNETWTFKAINDVETRTAYGWDDTPDVQSTVIVIGNY